MATHNAANERLKRRYFEYLREAARYDESTVDAVAKALHSFEADTGFRDFRQFRIEQAVAYKRHLAARRNKKTGRELGKSTVHFQLGHLKKFFQWLAGQPGFRSRISYADAEYFNLSEKDSRVARARREAEPPTLEQVLHVLATMSVETEIDRRNRALVAFILLTGARDGAVASMRLKHVNLERKCVFQDARDVKTKFSKSFTTYFFPVGEHVSRIVEEWVNYLRRDKLWSGDDPLFPATQIGLNADFQFSATGFKRECWQSASPIRSVFREAFAATGYPYFNPHSIRKTLVQLGEQRCQTPEEFKVWSQNLGHEGVLTTFLSYGQVAETRQGDIMRRLRVPASATQTARDLAMTVLRDTQQF